MGSCGRLQMRRELDSEAVERKWIERWAKADLSTAQRGNPTDPKFFLHFAYPGISGYLHVGHMRGFTYSDVFCRFHRMTGHRVLFPAGFHASGIPSVGLARRVERGDPATLEYLTNNGCPPDVLPKLKDPLEVVRYFSQVYADDYWKRFGFLIDWRTLCTTIDPGYQRFIQWQFKRLHDRNLLIQKPHYAPFCPLDGAVAVDQSETDISKGGNAEVVEYTILKFRTPQGWVLPCATLRPETVYGVTNLWLKPDGVYVRLQVGDETWVLSDVAAAKLAGLMDGVEAPVDDNGRTKLPIVTTAELLASTAANPFTGAKLPILPASFVDPGRATGVVMSVPAHAPYDWQALHEVRPDIAPIVIIRHPKVQGVPAEQAVKRHRVTSQTQKAELDAATEELYSEEFHGGELLPNTNRLSGLKVSVAKEEIKAILQQLGQYVTLQDFSEDVVCRCGRQVFVRKIPDQWFIKYSDEALTAESKQHAASMRVFPDDYMRDLPQVLDWFGDRACIRRGSWLGTEFPFKKGWIIEPIADSTFYSAYYIVSPYVNARRLKPDELTDAFFDYVFHGRGTAQSPTWDEVRKDFDYWYPVDINLGGKEHKTVHFPVYVMNHVALAQPNDRPRGIFVNWWVTQKAGAKISKSKGGAEPIPGAAAKYSVDGMRLYYCNVSSAHVDIEWDAEIVLRYRGHIERFHQFAHDLLEEPESDSAPGLDAWLDASWAQRWSRARTAFENFDLRGATSQVYYEFYNDLQWFRRRGGRRSKRAMEILRQWVASLTPVTPFLAEELWEALGGRGLASVAQLPPKTISADGVALQGEGLVRQVLDDVGTILRVTKKTPSKIYVYTAPQWKRTVATKVRAAIKEGRRDIGSLIKESLADPQLKPFAKDLPNFIQKALKDAQERPLAEGERIDLDEYTVLRDARPFLGETLNVPVEVYRADDLAAPDPANKRGVASPLKPALYIE